MQAKTRLGLTVVGLLAVVVLATSAWALGGTPEVCMTPDVVAAPGQIVACTLRNAYAYGTMDMVQLDLLDGDGKVIATASNFLLKPLTPFTLFHTIGAGDSSPFSCRVTVLAPVPGYVRLAIQRVDGLKTIVAIPATCNPF